MLDLSEEPRWGRVAESFGESPVLASRLAAAATQGFQGDDPSQPDRLAACAKHFVGYGLSAGGRDYDTVSVGENTLRNLHLRPFRAAVEAGVLSVMAAFNDVDGMPMHAHRHLLRDVLKGEWGFDGVVVGDWNGIGQIVFAGVAADDREAARLAIEAGVDLDMVSGAYLAHLADLVRDGEVDEALVDDACRRVLRMKFRLGLFDGAAAPGNRPVGNEPTTESRALARRAAVGAHVLVRNEGALPLGDEGSVLLTGAFAHEGDVLLGTWVLDGRGEDVVTPAAALTERLGDRLTVDDGRFPDRTLQLARLADVTVALVGEHPNRSGEANSVSDLRLPPGQLDLLRTLAGLRKPLVVVVYTGRPLDLTEVLDLADAVIVAWHPGVEAGSALADVLTGDAAPHGRLPMTFPLSTGHIPTSTHQRPTGRPIRADVDHREGRYVDALTYPRLPFGFGLTYSEVDYAAPQVADAEIGLESATTLTVSVTNTGDRPCREVVQAYFRDPVAQVTRPLVELLDWSVVDLEPGETRRGDVRGVRDRVRLLRRRPDRARRRGRDPADDRTRRRAAPGRVAAGHRCGGAPVIDARAQAAPDRRRAPPGDGRRGALLPGRPRRVGPAARPRRRGRLHGRRVVHPLALPRAPRRHHRRHRRHPARAGRRCVHRPCAPSGACGSSPGPARS